MAARQVEFQTSDLRLGEEFDTGYKALANRKAIKENGRLLLATIGDQIQRREVQERKAKGQNVSVSSWLRRLVDTVDTVLIWLEHSGKEATESLKKQEAVLRGIFHLTDLGNQASFFALLEVASEFLDTSEEPFQAERKFILSCQKGIEEQKERILRLVDEAGEILKAIINDENLDRQKGVQFDNIVRQANLEIRSCRRSLDSAEEKIDLLSTKMTTLKWFSRGVRLTGWGISTWYLYQKYNKGSIGIPLLLASSGIAAAAWLSLFPRRVYEFHENLSELASTHSQLTEKLVELREKLNSAKDYKDGLMKNVHSELRSFRSSSAPS